MRSRGRGLDSPLTRRSTFLRLFHNLLRGANGAPHGHHDAASNFRTTAPYRSCRVSATAYEAFGCSAKVSHYPPYCGVHILNSVNATSQERLCAPRLRPVPRSLKPLDERPILKFLLIYKNILIIKDAAWERSAKRRESRVRDLVLNRLHMIASPFQSTKWLTFGALLVRFFVIAHRAGLRISGDPYKWALSDSFRLGAAVPLCQLQTSLTQKQTDSDAVSQ